MSRSFGRNLDNIQDGSGFGAVLTGWHLNAEVATVVVPVKTFASRDNGMLR